VGDNHVDFQVGQLGRQRWQAVEFALSPTILNYEISAFFVPRGAKSVPQRGKLTL
jgi:hypothetical protein